MRVLLLGFLYVLSLGLLNIHAKFKDGLEVKFHSWLGRKDW